MQAETWLYGEVVAYRAKKDVAVVRVEQTLAHEPTTLGRSEEP
jgi:hypothetical protein